MRRIFIFILIFVALVAGLLFVAPRFISTDDLQQKALAQVESATGYRVRIDGPVRMAFFPSLDLVAADVGIAQPASGGPAEFATARTLKFGLKLRSLLAGKVRLTEVSLIDPVITLPLPEGAAPDAATPAEEGSGVTPQDLSLDELVIRNGTVILPGKNGEPGKQITGLDLEAALPFANGPLSFEGSANYDGKAIKASGSVGNFGHFVSGGPAPIQLKVDAPDLLPQPAEIAGTATYKDDTLILTKFAATSGDDAISGDAVYKDDTLTLSKFSARYDGATASGSGTYKDGVATLANFTATYDGATASGSGTYKDDVVTLNPVTITRDGHTVEGAVTANLKGEVPAIGAAFKANAIDLNRLLGETGGEARTAGGAKGWSDKPIDFAPLRKANVNLKLDVGQVTYDKIKLGAASLTAQLSGGKLTAEIPSVQLYGGGGSASVTIDASGQVPSHHLKLSLAKLDARPFLTDAVDFGTIEGKAAIDLNLTASGASERAMVSALNGTAKFAFTEGALRGINVPAMLRNLATGILTGWQVNEQAKTQFSTLGASFQIAGGQAKTDDLRLKGPLVSAGGAGTVDLPGRTLKFRVNPFMLASVEGGGGKNSMLGFPVPIAVSGPWDNPSFYPDIVGVLENPIAAYQQLDKLGGGLISMPANMLGLDTGEGGLVEKSVAVPTAITKGVVGGIGQMLGVKKKDAAAPAPQAAPADGAPAPAPAPATAADAQQPVQQQQAAPQQQPVQQQQAAPQPQPAPKQEQPAPGFGGAFGN